MNPPLMRRTLAASVTIAALALTTACAGGQSESEREREAAARAGLANLPHNAIEKYMMISGADPDEAAEESKEAASAAEQFNQARTAPGIVSAGAYTAAYNGLKALPSTGGSWADVTRVPYNSDDPRYRDYSSNSSGGLGYVSGRITGIAADNDSHVYAASANGGVWRSMTGTGDWEPISDDLPSLSSGDLTLDSAGNLWYATGEANTGGTAYAGAGVFELANPKGSTFSMDDRVGGQELDSTTIGRVRFGGRRVWLATDRGIWSRSITADKHAAWDFNFAPNMEYMPEITDDDGKELVKAGSECTDDTTCGPTDAAYKNIVNDIAVDPTNAKHVIAAIGWRSGDTYNGFYESRDAGKSWKKINPTGAMPADDIGYVTFAWASDASKLYAINQSPKLLNKATGTVNSYLDGIYVSKNGSISGPWTKIATSSKLASSGSALKQSVGGKGYGPGVQSWYNQFLQVDPKNADHVYAGLEEVYETKDAGASWTTPGPYWNFYFPCWSLDDATNTCPSTSHPDQHSAAIGMVGPNHTPTFFAGNDGGIYSRPVDGKANKDGHATDWSSLTQDGTMDGLQYYGIAIGADKAHGGMVVSGGMQDNGASNLYGVLPDGSSTDTEMGSNFGGDGGDAMADPEDGCNQVQEYVYLSMSVTNNCAQNTGALTRDDATSWSIDPGDPGARFTAPFDDDTSDPTHWIAGGQYVWRQDQGYDIRKGSEWNKVFDLGAGHSATALALTDGVGYVGWCGPCNNQGFTRGLATNASGTWQQVDLPDVPNRYIGGIGIDPKDGKHAFLAMNGFSRRFTEGPGAGIGHVFETTDGGVTWTDISANLPDVPTSSIKETEGGALVLGTDLGVVYRAPGQTEWQRLGGNLPLTTVMDVELSPDQSMVYAGTHGRGIWSIPLPR